MHQKNYISLSLIFVKTAKKILSLRECCPHKVTNTAAVENGWKMWIKFVDFAEKTRKNWWWCVSVGWKKKYFLSNENSLVKTHHRVWVWARNVECVYPW